MKCVKGVNDAVSGCQTSPPCSTLRGGRRWSDPEGEGYGELGSEQNREFFDWVILIRLGTDASVSTVSIVLRRIVLILMPRIDRGRDNGMT